MTFLKELGNGLGKAKEFLEEEERNHLPENQCRSKRRTELPSPASLSMPGMLHQWAQILTRLMPQEYKTLSKAQRAGFKKA